MDITLVRDSPGGNITAAVYYPYNPSLPAAYGFMAAFAVATVAHFIYMFPLRAWYFITFIIGGLCETLGYYARSQSHDHVSKTGSWMLQMVMILGAPTFFAATIYMTLGRLTVALGAEQFSMISPRWLTRLYVCIDVLCFLSQFAGAGVQASGNQQIISIGNKVIFGGLLFQLVAFGFFILIARRISVRFARFQETSDDRYAIAGWKKHFRVLYVISGLFIIRNSLRAIEYGQIAMGSGGFSFATRDADGTLHYDEARSAKIGDHESLVYIFDAAIMLCVVVGFLIVHPGKFLKEAREGNWTKMESVEMKNSGA